MKPLKISLECYVWWPRGGKPYLTTMDSPLGCGEIATNYLLTFLMLTNIVKEFERGQKVRIMVEAIE